MNFSNFSHYSENELGNERIGDWVVVSTTAESGKTSKEVSLCFIFSEEDGEVGNYCYDKNDDMDAEALGALEALAGEHASRALRQAVCEAAGYLREALEARGLDRAVYIGA